MTSVRLEEAVRRRGDFERDAARHRVQVEFLAIGGVFGKDRLIAGRATDGPEVDGGVALVGDYSAAYGENTSGKSREYEDG